MAKWAHTKGLTISKILGSEKERLKALEAKADIYTINRENVVWIVNHYKKKWPFDFVVIDELSSFKSHSAARFKALRKVRPLIRKISGLTGTPAPNGLLDLWAQLYLLDQGERLGKTYTGFRERFFQPGRVGKNAHGRLIAFDYEPRPGSEEEIYRLIGDICISMKAKDWLSLPERINVEHRVKLTGKVLADYKRLERDYILEYEGGDIEAATAAVLRGKLLQLASGAVYDEHKIPVEIHNLKLDALEDLIEAANGKPVMVVYWYKHELARIRKRFSAARMLKTAEDQNDWNAGKIPILLLHPMSGGHGLNIQAGGHIQIWYTLTDSLELYQQTCARLDRQGQTERPIIQHIIAEGTVDEDVVASLINKDATQEELMQAVKARINKILNT